MRKTFLIIKNDTKKTTELLESHESMASISHNQTDVEYIEMAINNLPIKSKAVFVMAEIEGFSHKEIAETLSISVGTSKSQLHYAKNILKKKISSLHI